MKKLQDPDYKPDENTKSEIERLHREGESLSGLQLSFADLKNANLVDADLESCDLKGANLSNASMYGANLEGANLFKADLEGTNLKNANLKNCQLLGANFSDTKLHNINWGKEGKIIIWNDNHEVINSFNIDSKKTIRNISLSYDNKYLAIGSNNGTIDIINLETNNINVTKDFNTQNNFN